MADFLMALTIAGQCAVGITGVTVILMAAVMGLNNVCGKMQ